MIAKLLEAFSVHLSEYHDNERLESREVYRTWMVPAILRCGLEMVASLFGTAQIHWQLLFHQTISLAH
jgi:hypothetical protein